MPSPSDYIPRPLDLSAVQLPADVQNALERIAQNIHENWAAQRLADGWTFGPERNDSLKTHPSLIPYDQLDESEKNYDRLVVTQSIKSLLALGFRIHKETQP